MKPTIAVDFDGVLNTYTGWKGEDELFQPRPGAREFLEALAAGFTVVIHSTRAAAKIREWLSVHGMADFVWEVTNRKVPAVAYIDDRAVRFDGDYAAALEALKNFRPHWRDDSVKETSG
jgi:hypothetical protein